jgi:hypothetical protein
MEDKEKFTFKIDFEKENKIDLIKKAFKEDEKKEETFIDFILKEIYGPTSLKINEWKNLFSRKKSEKEFFIDGILKKSDDKQIEFFFNSFIFFKQTLNEDIKNKIDLIKKAFKEDEETEEAFIDTMLKGIYDLDSEFLQIDYVKKSMLEHRIKKDFFINDIFKQMEDKVIESLFKTIITSKQEEENNSKILN